MTPESLPRSNPFWMRIVGWILTILPVGMLTMSGIMKMQRVADVMELFNKLNIPDLAFTIGAVEITCAVLYLIPQTAMLGAILLVGYLGGAVLAHLQHGPRIMLIGPVIFGVVVWLGLWFRDPRVRALAPFRK